MPTLFRFLVMIGIIVGIAYAGMFALVSYVDPEPREIVVTIPSSKLGK